MNKNILLIAGSLLLAGANLQAQPAGGLIFRLKASDLGLADGASVGTWASSVGGSGNAVQANPANQPIFKTGVLNGKAVVRFADTGSAATSSYMDTDAFSYNANSGNFSVFAALKLNLPDGGSRDVILQTQDLSGNAAGRTILYAERMDANYLPTISAASALSTNFYGFARGSGSTNGSLVDLSSGFRTVGISYDYTVGANGAYAFYQNGALDGAGSLYPGTTSLANGLWRIGSKKGAAGNWLDGDVAEILIYNRAVDANDVAQINSYFQSEYGLVAIPEPSMLALTGLGVAALLARSQRRRA